MKQIMIVFFFSLMSVLASADDNPQLISAGIRNAFIPAGFDSNDRAQIVIEGTLGGDCHKVGPTEVKVDRVQHIVEIDQKIYDYQTACHFILVTYSKTVDIGILSAGDYKVVDKFTQKTLGILPVKLTNTPSADDYLYAPLSDVIFLPKTRQLVIQGTFSNNCMRMKNVITKLDGDHVMVVLPIAELLDPADTCAPGSFPFVRKVSVPKDFKDGEHYLIHARSLDGQSINKVINSPYF